LDVFTLCWESIFELSTYPLRECIPSVSGQTVVVVIGVTDGVVDPADGCDAPVPTKNTKNNVMHFICI
jgi:hypothetical protein